MNYKSLSINQKINAKGNAGLLYTTFALKYIGLPLKPLIHRVKVKNADIFTPEMLLDGNTKTI